MKVWDTEEFKEYHAMHSDYSDYATVIFLATCSGSRRGTHRPVTSAIMLKAPWGIFKGENYIDGVFKGTAPPDGGVKVFSQQVRPTGEVYGRKTLLSYESFSINGNAVDGLMLMIRLKCMIPGCPVEARMKAYRISRPWHAVHPWRSLERRIMKRKTGAPIGVIKINFAELEENLEDHNSVTFKSLQRAMKARARAMG